MITAFDLIQALGSWFYRRGEAIFTGGKDIDTGGGNIVVGTGTVDGVDLTAHVADTDAHHNEAHTLASHSGTLSHDSDLSDVSANDHHNQSHVLATGSALGPDHTISGAASGQVLRASSSTAARFDPLAHADLGSVTANQHHNESHSVASHSDTSATGSELNTLTDGSDASSLHDHDGRYYEQSDFSNYPSNEKPLKSNSSGGLNLGQNLAADGVVLAGDDIKAGGGLISGSSTANVPTGMLIIKEVGSAGTPSSTFAAIYIKSDGLLYYKNDGGQEREISYTT